MRRNGKAVALALTIALTLTLALAVGQNRADAKHSPDHVPANKVAVNGTTVDVHAPQAEAVLLATTMRNPDSKALVLQVTLECSILTDLQTTGDDFARAESTLEVWAEINGQRVDVSDEDDGEVTFCNREYQRRTQDWND